MFFIILFDNKLSIPFFQTTKENYYSGIHQTVKSVIRYSTNDLKKGGKTICLFPDRP